MIITSDMMITMTKAGVDSLDVLLGFNIIIIIMIIILGLRRRVSIDVESTSKQTRPRTTMSTFLSYVS